MLAGQPSPNCYSGLPPGLLSHLQGKRCLLVRVNISGNIQKNSSTWGDSDEKATRVKHSPLIFCNSQLQPTKAVFNFKNILLGFACSSFLLYKMMLQQLSEFISDKPFLLIQSSGQHTPFQTVSFGMEKIYFSCLAEFLPALS